MKYNIIAARYEGTQIFGTYLYCTTNDEIKAEAIVNALNASPESSIFQFCYLKAEN